jgi:hypothetical protein
MVHCIIEDLWEIMQVKEGYDGELRMCFSTASMAYFELTGILIKMAFAILTYTHKLIQADTSSIYILSYFSTNLSGLFKKALTALK